jgi:hypothetical protein
MEQEMKKTQKHMDDLHFEHKVWTRQLEFSKDEIMFFKERAGEISQRYTDKEVLKRLEHFQNQFIIQENEIDEFLHVIRLHEDSFVKEVEKNSVAIDHRFFNDHGDERDRFDMFVKLYGELKTEFMNYLRKWM